MNITKVKKIKPLYNKIVTTVDLYEQASMEGDVIDTTKDVGSIKEYQTVVAVGDTVKNIKVGDVVLINPDRYAIKKHKEGSMLDGVIKDNPILTYNFPIIEVNDTPYMLIYDSDVDYIIEEYEESTIVE